jgi:protein-glutamine gamma-glutamyltransferase
MLEIAGHMADIQTMAVKYPPRGVEMRILDTLHTSSRTYEYDSTEQLDFELKLRKSIIQASVDLNRSRLAFKTFRDSECNPDFWMRTSEGGFRLMGNVTPYDAIRDIYEHSREYGTECSTAMVIVIYKALLGVYPKELFNRIFPRTYLMNWQHLDRDLGVESYEESPDYLPGDCRYFKNPDVDPETPEWQGENAIDLGNGAYYGHGIGIASARQILSVLNKYRIEGSDVQAYLMDSVTRPDFRHLACIYQDYQQTAGTRQAWLYGGSYGLPAL